MVFMTIFLKLFILFQEVMHIEHEGIVRGTERDFHSHGSENPLHLPLKPTFQVIAHRGGDRNCLGIGFGQVGKPISGDPVSPFGRVDVGEKAQNSGSVERTGRKRIDMEQVISRSQSQFSPFFLKGSEAGVIVLPFFCIGREESG